MLAAQGMAQEAVFCSLLVFNELKQRGLVSSVLSYTLVLLTSDRASQENRLVKREEEKITAASQHSSFTGSRRHDKY